MRICDNCHKAYLRVMEDDDYLTCDVCGKKWKTVDSDFSDITLKLESNITQKLEDKKEPPEDKKPEKVIAKKKISISAPAFKEDISPKRILKMILSSMLALITFPVVIVLIYGSILNKNMTTFIFMVVTFIFFYVYLYYDARYGKL